MRKRSVRKRSEEEECEEEERGRGGAKKRIE